MNNSQIDVLLQLPVSRPEPSSSATRPRGDSPAFGNHFRQASDASGPLSPPPAPAPPPTNSAADGSPKNTADERPPAHAEHARRSSDHENSQRASESESSTADAAAADRVEDDRANEDRDNDDAEREQSAEVAAVLAAAEQLAKSTTPEATSVEETSTTDRLAVESAADPLASPSTSDKDAAKFTPHAKGTANASPVDLQPRDANLSADAAGDKLPQADKALPTAKTAAVELEDADQPSEENVERPVVAQETFAKRSDKVSRNEVGPAHDTGHNQPTVAAAPSTQKFAQTVSLTTKNAKTATNDAAKKSDKKSTTRVSSAQVEATLPNTERPLAPAGAADTPAAARVASQQSQVPVAASVTVAATTDSAASPKDALTSKPGPLSPFARLERGTHTTRESQRTGHGEAARHVDPARFVSRVARAIETAQERGGPLQLRLSPPELGAMRLEISVNQGALTATIETDNQSARQLLLDNLPALRERLAEQNVKIERFDVDVRRDSTGSQQNPASHDRGTNEHSSHRSGGQSSARRDAIIPSVDDAEPIRRTITTTSINVVA